MKKKIAILLPYKDQFTKYNAGSASIWVKDFNKYSNFTNHSTIFGHTKNHKSIIQKKNYKNILINEQSFFSKNKDYVSKFITYLQQEKFDLVEIHNRPSYLKQIYKKFNQQNFILIFHNNPLTLKGSKTISERMILLKICKKIIFVSNWVKEKFFHNLKIYNHQNCVTIYPSVERIKKFPAKKRNIIFVGKLNRSKGFHLFGNVIIKILKKYPNWFATIVGDEPREKYNFKHKNLYLLGWIDHQKTLKQYEQASIAVTPSFWEEPFGRTSMESASRGCATIISKKGGLTETIPYAVYLNKLTNNELFSKIENLIINKKKRLELQKKSYRNIYHELKSNTKKIDSIKQEILYESKIFNIIKNKKLKIIHISNFGSRLFNRIYHISIAKKLTNGFTRLGHDVINISDRDILRQDRTFSDTRGIKSLNDTIFQTVKNYNPNLIILGHSFEINVQTLEQIKSFDKKIKIAQWYEDHLAKSGPDYQENRIKFLKYGDFIEKSFITTHPSALSFLNKKNSFYMPIPVDENIESLKVYEYKNQKNDLFFTMSHGVNRGVLKKNKIDERVSFISKLVNNAPEIIYDIYGHNGREPVWGEDFYKAIKQSKMGLNLSRGKPIKYLTSNRIASLIGNGLLTFIDKRTQLADFFNPNEVIFYNNVNDLSEKLIYFKENNQKRMQFAKNGRKKYFDLFESKIICDYMISKIFGVNSKKNKNWMKN